MYWLFYAAIPAAVGILALFSAKTKVPEGCETKGMGGLFARIATYLYERMPGEFVRRQIAPMERSLRLLQPATKTENAGKVYTVKKLADLLMLLTAGSILGIALYVTARQDHVFSSEGVIERASYMEEEKTVCLEAAGEEGEQIGAFDVTISSRRYTAEEAKRLFQEAADLLPEAIRKDNPSLNEVTTDLSLVTALEGYPFTITWKSGNYGRIRSDGRLDLEDIAPEGEVVMLTAQFDYGEETYEQVLYAHVKSPVPDAETLQRQSMEALLREADRATIYEEQITLPKTLEERAIVWKEQIKDSSSMIFFLVLLAAVLVFVARDKEVQRQMETRRYQMLSDYPRFVSQIVLYLGAGMTIRGIMKKLGADYAARRKQGAPMRYLYEELRRMTYGMESGVAEARVYEQFGLRCGIQQYTRLCTLLTQNLRKGSNDLLRLLEEESGKAFAERVDLARKRGEEAGTKLLVPMMLLLGIVMIIIMIPAYTAF